MDAKYRSQNAEFNEWARGAWMSTMTHEELDLAPMHYLNEMFFEGYLAHLASKMLAAMIFCRSLPRGSSTLPRSREVAMGWRRLAPKRSRLALPYTMACLIATNMVLRGAVEAARCTMFTFALYLRPSEALRFEGRSLVRPSKRKKGAVQYWALVMHAFEGGVSSKVREFDESVMLNSPAFHWLTDLAEKHVRGPRKLFDLTYGEWASALRETCAELRIEHIRLVLYKLRHGGATHVMATKARPLAEIKLRGRWASDNSLRRYVKGVRVAQALGMLGHS